jgi:hypothetical protein
MVEALSVQIPGTTRELLERLKKSFGVTSDAEVLSRALGLANTAVEVAGSKSIVTLTGEHPDTSVTVSLDK